MANQENRHPRLGESREPETEYRAISALAVSALVVATASSLALVTMSPALAFIPAAGVALAVAALARIARSDGALLGRKPALAGLAISLLCLSALAAYWPTHRWLIRREARQFAAAWFDLLARNEPLKADQLTRNPEHRKPLDDRLWDFYRGDPESLQGLEGFVSDPVVRTLLALDGKAQVRYYESQDQTTAGPVDRVNLVYAVSYSDNGRKKTFFVRLHLERFHFETTGRGDWRVLKSEGGIRPRALGGEEDEQAG